MDFKVICWAYVFKDFQEKTGVKWSDTPRKIQSAVEPFLENEMSDANREQVTALLNSVWIQLLPIFRKVEYQLTTK
jgi:protease-4